jgi:hypothetical protein
MLVLTAAVAAANFAGTASAQEAAGTVLWSMGQVERLSAAGTAKVLSKGDEVFEGDTIRAAAGAHAQLRMRDEALLAVRPDSQMRLETYAYRGAEDGTERAVIELIKGGMRSITGAVGRNNKENVLTRTPTVLIGIRGTDHETFVTSEGTYDRVSVGGTYLQSAGGRLDLDAGQIGFASLTAGAGPSRLDRTPEFMQIAAIVNGNTGPALRLDSSGDRGRLAKDLPGAALRGAAPAVPAAVLVDGKGGRCGGPCSDPLLNPGLGYGKGKGKGKP